MDYEQCIIWEPELKQPETPSQIGRFIPIYPVVKAKCSPSSTRKGWYWLWECVQCGREKVMSRGYIMYSDCICTSTKRSESPKYPYEEYTECNFCGASFTFLKTALNHHIKYCSSKCVSLAKSKFQSSLKRKEETVVSGFDRRSFCMRKKKPAYELCDYYHVCMDCRIDGFFGPYHKVDGSCYLYSGINNV
jgi:hypothetical protein